MRVLVDLTEFFSSPHRTGIQRVAGELCRRWPQSVPLIPAKWVEGKGLVELPSDALHSISRYFTAIGDQQAAVANLRELAQRADQDGKLWDGTEPVLVPEVFYDPKRVAYFRHLDQGLWEKFHFIVFDLLPLTHPQHFSADIPHEVISDYFRLIRESPHTSFISGQTREAYYRRLRRTPVGDGPVLRLGSDGFGQRAMGRPPNPDPLFVVVGTIEPRKGHLLVLDAFEPLFDQYPSLQLAFLGRIGWADKTLVDRIQRLAQNSQQFRLVENPDDPVIRAYVAKARATLFLSTAEGFGLPPVESLWLGTPVIAPARVPSLEQIGARGVCLVDPLTAEGVRNAVISLLDAGTFRQKADEARQLLLPTWNSFAHQTAEWVARSS